MFTALILLAGGVALSGCDVIANIVVSSPCKTACTKKFDECATRCEMQPTTQKSCLESCSAQEESCDGSC